MVSIFIMTEVRTYRESLTHILSRSEGLRVVGDGSCPDDLLAAARELRPDVLLMDAPLEQVRDAVRVLRDAAADSRVVALGVREIEDEVLDWARTGAAGFVSADCSLDELVGILRSVARGEHPCSPKMAGVLVRAIRRLATGADRRPPRTPLTCRECEVIDLVELGLSNKQIARTLGISLSTVKNHLHNVYEKLHVHGRAAALSRLGRRYRPPVRHGDVRI